MSKLSESRKLSTTLKTILSFANESHCFSYEESQIDSSCKDDSTSIMFSESIDYIQYLNAMRKLQEAESELCQVNKQFTEGLLMISTTFITDPANIRKKHQRIQQLEQDIASLLSNGKIILSFLEKPRKMDGCLNVGMSYKRTVVSFFGMLADVLRNAENIMKDINFFKDSQFQICEKTANLLENIKAFRAQINSDVESLKKFCTTYDLNSGHKGLVVISESQQNLNASSI